MPDRMSACIEIGGKLRQAQADVLIGAILADAPCWEYGESAISHITWEELNRADEPLALVDDSACNGEFPEIERVAAELGLTFVRRSEGKYEYDPEIAWFTPDMTATRVAVSDANHHPVMQQSEVEKAIRMMRRGRVAAAQEHLEKLVVRIPKVPSLRITA